MKYIIFVVVSLLFYGCSTKEFKVLDLNDTKVKELSLYPQQTSSYISNKAVLKKVFSRDSYLEHYYRIWLKEPKTTQKEAMWAFRVYHPKRKLYGVNLQPLKKDFYTQCYDNSNFDTYKSINKKALTIKDTSLRIFPTQEMAFSNPNKAGSGFPFDLLQNSLIEANKPLFVSHFSKDKRWAYVFSSFASGWVKKSDIVFVDDSFFQKRLNAEYVTVIKDNYPLYDKNGEYLFSLRIGEWFVIAKEDLEFYTIEVVSKEDIDTPKIKKIKVPKDVVQKAPLVFDKKNIITILDGLKTSRYGWGGLFLLRDCSSTMRDYFSAFGVWLPRNSAAQAKVGKVIDLEGLDEKAKLEKIKQEGIPFETLLYKKGHIVLYLGIYHNKVMLFQNLWGIKTKYKNKTGRVVIARAIFYPIDIGKDLEYFDKENNLLDRLKTLSIPTQ